MITFLESFQEELNLEAIGTRKMLALVPADQWDYAPHPKSMKMGALAIHIADIPNWIGLALKTEVLDLALTPYQPKEMKTAEELITYFNQNVEKALEDLQAFSDAILTGRWIMKHGDAILVDLTKLQTIRHSFCQMTHHRAQLGVYLRLLDIPLPGVYGPSADEMSE